MTIIAKPYVTQEELDAFDWIFSPDNPANQEGEQKESTLTVICPHCKKEMDDYHDDGTIRKELTMLDYKCVNCKRVFGYTTRSKMQDFTVE